MTDHETAGELMSLARHLLRHGNAEDAIVLLDSALALMPDDLAIATLQAEAAHKVGRNEEAHTRIRDIVDRVAPDTRAPLELLDAKILLALGRRDEAQAAYRRALPDVDLFGRLETTDATAEPSNEPAMIHGEDPAQ
jgi:tetratricopeptide (TPR) repeat protein